MNKQIQVILGLLIATPALAHNDCTPVSGKNEYVKRFTNYSPIQGGINGRCGTSASGRDACKYFLEDYLSNSAPAVMGAVPQRGGTQRLFGGMYRGVALERSLGSKNCIRLIVGDRYSSTSNNMSKMDIVTRHARSAITARVNMARGELQPLGRAPGIKPPVRKLHSKHLSRKYAAKKKHQYGNRRLASTSRSRFPAN